MMQISPRLHNSSSDRIIKNLLPTPRQTLISEGLFRNIPIPKRILSHLPRNNHPKEILWNRFLHLKPTLRPIYKVKLSRYGVTPERPKSKTKSKKRS
jgi:hypothetical protein